MRYLLDANAVIGLLNDTTSGLARRARREEFVETLISAIPVVPLGLDIMRIFGEVDARLHAKGSILPTSDLLIASTALSRGDAIVTGNARHFRRVPGLKVHKRP